MRNCYIYIFFWSLLSRLSHFRAASYEWENYNEEMFQQFTKHNVERIWHHTHKLYLLHVMWSNSNIKRFEFRPIRKIDHTKISVSHKILNVFVVGFNESFYIIYKYIEDFQKREIIESECKRPKTPETILNHA